MRVFLVLYLMSLSSVASLSKFVKEGLSDSSLLKVQKLKVDNAGIDLDLLKTATNISFFFDGFYQDSKLESPLFSFNSIHEHEKKLSLGLSKTFDWGGKLSLLNNYTNANVVNTTNVYSFFQTLRYEQNIGKDFFGSAYKSETEVFEKRKELEESKSNLAHQKQLYDLAQAYLKSKFLKTSLMLQKKSTQRSYRQLRLVKRKLRDGLLEKVDLREAEVAYYLSKENEERILSQFNSSKIDIEELVERPVINKEIKSFKSSLAKIPVLKGSVSKNIDVKILEKQRQINLLSQKKFKTDFLPNMNILLEYGTNDYSNRSSSAFKEGYLGKGKNYKKIGVNASWDLGASKSNLEKRKNKIDSLIIETRLNLNKKNIEREETRIKANLENIEGQIKYAYKRKESARKSLVGYERLYKKGRVELDQLIRSETNLISSELGLASKLQERLSYYFGLAYLYGDIESAIERYSE